MMEGKQSFFGREPRDFKNIKSQETRNVDNIHDKRPRQDIFDEDGDLPL